PPPALVGRLDVELAGAELEDPLEDIDRHLQAAGAGERAVEANALATRLSGDLDPRELLAGPYLEVGERLVVLEIFVEPRSQVLDHPRLGKQGGDRVSRLDIVDVADEPNPVADAGVGRGLLVEVRRRPAAEVLRLPNVDDHAGGVLHQVDAGCERERLDLL